MPVNNTHAAYSAASQKWKRVRDAIDGVDAVKSAGEAYLPRLSGQSNKEYAAYVQRAGWFGATARTIDALHGLIFRKPAEVVGPVELVEDITMTGKSAADFASDVARQLLEVGRVGVMIDHATASEDVLISNAAQAAALGLRPYATMYSAERIINWRSARVNGAMALTLVVLSEDDSQISDDGFAVKTSTQYRVLRLENGVYVQELWKKSNGGEFVMVSKTTPLMRGAVMTSIPFLMVSTNEIGEEIIDPPLIDLADINLSHYRTGADLEHGAHFTALPTAVISGYQRADQNESLSIGSTQAWVFPDPQASAKFLEYTGAGLSTIEKMLDRKEQQMSQMGARMLTDQKNGVESGKALEIRSSGENSLLGGVAVIVSLAITKALEIAAEWAGQSGKVSCLVNTDYTISNMDPQKLTALVSAWQAGAISHKTLFWNLKQGEIVADDVEFEDESALIEDEGPTMDEEISAAVQAATMQSNGKSTKAGDE